MLALPRLLVALVFLSSGRCCIPTITPDDMYEQEMEATTTSVLMSSVITMAEQSTSPATSAPTTTTIGTTTSTSTSTTTTTTATGICPTASWAYNPVNNKCYLMIPGVPTAVSNMDCEAGAAMGSALASIHSMDENTFITNYLVATFAGGFTNPSHFVYIGGYSATGMLGDWSWTDGTMYGPYENWFPPGPEPDSTFNCMGISAWGDTYDGLWANGWCASADQPILCMMEAT